MKVYSEYIDVAYFDCDNKAKMTATDLLKYLSEISIRHNEVSSQGKDPDRKYGWMLNKWKIDIKRYPGPKEKLKLETWISKAELFYANREFLLLDSNGKEVLNGTALWIFLDMEKRRPTRIKEDIINRDEILDKSYFRDFTRFSRDLDYKELIEFNVRRLDIDTNQHVNNVKYFIWMMEAIPSDIIEDYYLKDFEIDYKQEVTYPSKVSSKIKMEKTSKGIKIYHGIFEDDKGKDNALAFTNWVKRPR